MLSFLLLAFVALVKTNLSQTGCPNTDIQEDCKRCGSQDDPHIVTLDGLSYDQHTNGCFQYVTTCPTASVAQLPFEVCGCHYACGSLFGGTGREQCPSSVSCIGDTTVTFFDSVGAEAYMVKVEVADASTNAVDMLTNSALTSGSSYVFDATTGDYFVYSRLGNYHTIEVFSGPTAPAFFYAHISYTPGTLQVFLSETYFSDNACGLCGYFNGDQSDDFTGSDNTFYVDPLDVGSAPHSAVVNAQINNFANTYLCDASDPTPFDPGCADDPAAAICVNQTIACCEELWDQMISSQPWENSVVPEAEYYEQWLINCALDACALTYNSPDCAAMGEEFAYAKGAFEDMVGDDYVITFPPDDDYESNCTAKICAHGDNEITLDVSSDGGASWVLGVASETNWRDTLIASIHPVDANTVLRFTVTDYGFVGGFIATIELCGGNGYVHDFWSNEVNTWFDVISDSAGDMLLDAFTAFGDGPWATHVNPTDVQCMKPYAHWMWNDKKRNTMVFEFDFGHHLEILARLDCWPADTPAPTPSDCCNLTLDEFLDTCYCSDEPSQTPSPLRIISGDPVEVDVAVLSEARAGQTVLDSGMNQVDKENKLLSELQEIKNMIYATWMALFVGLVVIVVVMCGMRMSGGAGQFRQVAKHVDDEF